MNIRRTGLDAIIAHARETSPSECCGVLLGDEACVVEAVPARNLSEDPNRFLLDPRDHFKALRDGRTRGLDVVGFYHSHPHSAPVPSPTDRAEAAYPALLHLIVSLEHEPPEIRAFVLETGCVREVGLVEAG